MLLLIAKSEGLAEERRLREVANHGATSRECVIPLSFRIFLCRKSRFYGEKFWCELFFIPIV